MSLSIARCGLAVVLILTFAAEITHSLAEPSSNPAFERTWSRTDQPVADGLVSRTWIWGPEPFAEPILEPYAESPGKQRLTQYFDKSRMELTFPDGDQDAPWYVTNGLLVQELISGRLQVGHEEFEEREPAYVNVAGDDDDRSGPTYAALSTVLNEPPTPVGHLLNKRIGRDGTVTEDQTLDTHGVLSAYLDDVTNHAIAEPFWKFMNSSGVVYESGEISITSLFKNPFFATGRPVTEAYWARVKVAGTEHNVLLQCFERRCLTYTPGNPDGWQVEAGNVGRHYFTWRYEHSESPQTPDSPPTSTAAPIDSQPPASVTPVPTSTLAPTPTITLTPPPVGGPGCVAGEQAKLVSVTDGLGHTNPNSWAKETGGDWIGGLSASPEIQVGTTLTVSVTATGECPVEYRFSKTASSVPFTVLRDWSSGSTFTYTVKPEDYGIYFMITVEIRDSDPRSRFNEVDDYTYLTYIVDGPPAPGSSCVANPQATIVQVTDGLGNTNPNSWGKDTGGNWIGGLDASPVVSVGTTLNVTVVATGECPIEYRFSKSSSSLPFTTVQDWSTKSSFSYTIRQEDFGMYFMIIPEIRDSDPRSRFNEVDDYNYLTYIVK